MVNKFLKRRSFMGQILPNDYFITEWTVNASDIITLPLINGGVYSFNVDWGDGTTICHVSSFNDPNASHTYTTGGVYEVKMLGVFNRFQFNNIGSKLKITDVKQWGINEFSALNFWGCTGLSNLTPVDTPNLNGGALDSLFRLATNLISVTNINSWDLSNVTTNLTSAFEGTKFNQDISSWDISGIIRLNNTFKNSLFNQPLNSWNPVLVGNYSGCFQGSSFNQPLNNWNVTAGVTMGSMFRSSPFDQDISMWNVINMTSAAAMFLSSTLSTVNYDALLVGWDSLNLKPNVTFGAGNSQYTLGSAADTARANMIASDGWTITDGGGI